MSERILLSTYAVKILDNARNEQVLSNFSGTNDFLNIFHHFTDNIHQNIEQQLDISNRTTLHLTIDRPVIFNSNERLIYGYFSSGVSGERFDIRDML